MPPDSTLPHKCKTHLVHLSQPPCPEGHQPHHRQAQQLPKVAGTVQQLLLGRQPLGRVLLGGAPHPALGEVGDVPEAVTNLLDVTAAATTTTAAAAAGTAVSVSGCISESTAQRRQHPAYRKQAGLLHATLQAATIFLHAPWQPNKPASPTTHQPWLHCGCLRQPSCSTALTARWAPAHGPPPCRQC